MIHRTPFFVPWLYSSLQWRVMTQQKELYLTFDDGPVPGPTDFVVETLRKYNAKASFFCIGDNVRKHNAVMMKAAEDGHKIANHTHNHVKGWNVSTETYLMNIKNCDIEITSHGLPRPTLFRPPYGRIRNSQVKALKDEYVIIMWDVLTFDYNASLSPGKCLKGTLDAVRPGSIIVFHDSFKAEKNMTYALPRLLDHFSEKGFSFNAL
jgi:peptidoglycan/xylan/chitin deacetylase (PgdA/CDA1 family)